MTAQRLTLLASAFALAPAALVHAATQVVIVEGLGGDERYAAEFARQSAGIEAASRTLRPEPEFRILRGAEAGRDQILARLADIAALPEPPDLLLLYLVGHGSFDEHEYKFNLPGPDLTDADLQQAFDAMQARTLVVIDTSSASGAAHDRWQGESRIVITATRSGVERHATRFGGYFATALADPGADIDKNERVSAQEAFDYASRAVEEHFRSSGQLATEHARISGAGADRVALARLGAPRPVDGDPALRGLIERRDGISGRIDALRLERDDLPADRYQERLLDLMLELAEIEERIEQAGERPR